MAIRNVKPVALMQRCTLRNQDRERLQKQISHYAERHHAERAKAESKARLERLRQHVEAPTHHKLESFVADAEELVDRLFYACGLC